MADKNNDSAVWPGAVPRRGLGAYKHYEAMKKQGKISKEDDARMDVELKKVGQKLQAEAEAKVIRDKQEKIKRMKELDQYKKGGKVKKTGPAVVHKDEVVLTTKQAKKLEKSPKMKKKIMGKKHKEKTVSDYRAQR